MLIARCHSCPFRARFDKNPQSLLGRIWKWHTNWCPGWKMYMKSLTDAERADVKAKYNLR